MYNYQWELGRFPITCLCGSPECCGLLGQPQALTTEEAEDFGMDEEVKLLVEYSDYDVSDDSDDAYEPDDDVSQSLP